MTKNLTRVVSFLTTIEMYEQLHEVSKKRDASVSQLIRALIREFLQSENKKGRK